MQRMRLRLQLCQVYSGPSSVNICLLFSEGHTSELNYIGDMMGFTTIASLNLGEWPLSLQFYSGCGIGPDLLSWTREAVSVAQVTNVNC